MLLKFLSIFLVLMIVFPTLYAQTPYANASLYGDHSFSDFADITLYATGSAGYYWTCTAYYFTDWYNGSTWVQEDVDTEIEDWGYVGLWQTWSITNKSFAVDNIAYREDGTFRVRFSVRGDAANATDTHQFTVTDNTAPSVPSGLDIEEEENHPYLSWNANIEIDLKEYNVYKKVGTASYEWLANTTSTNYMDEDELMNGSQQYPNPTVVQYKITAEDYTSNESAFSTAVQCTCKGLGEDGRISHQFAATSELNGIPFIFEIQQNYPNPFNPETNITFGIPEDNFVNLVVYNIQGEKVTTLVNEQLEAGSYTAKFDASTLPSGVYIYKIQAGSFSQINRMLLIK